MLLRIPRLSDFTSDMRTMGQVNPKSKELATLCIDFGAQNGSS